MQFVKSVEQLGGAVRCDGALTERVKGVWWTKLETAL